MDELHPRTCRPSSKRQRRATQACENCRRKKSRCTGEQPRCSVCIRLRQQCTYASNIAQSGEERKASQDETPECIKSLEEKIERLTEVIRKQSKHDEIASTTSTRSQHAQHAHAQAGISHRDVLGRSISERISTKTAEQGVGLYFANSCGKPFPLLWSRHEQGYPSVSEIPELVLCPMLALSLRTSTDCFPKDIASFVTDLEFLAGTAWTLLSARYMDFDIDENFFEGLCLLAQVQFATGQTQRALAQIALALSIANSRGMLKAEASSDGISQLRRR